MNTTQPQTPGCETILRELTLDLTAAAVRVGGAYAAAEVLDHLDLARGPRVEALIEVWEAMTGLPSDTAKIMCEHIIGAHDQVTAAVIPL